MARTPIWSSISTALTAEIAAGTYAQGSKLPTEAQLALRFGVNRHTVRRALGVLAEAGLVQPRRGAGVFVTSVPTDYPLGRRVRFHQNVLANGRTPSRRMLRTETRPASAEEAEALALPLASMVHLFEGLSLADGVPIGLFRSVLPAKLANGVQAGHLQLAQGAPLLRSVTINVDVDGRPVEFGTSWFSGDRVTLTVVPE